MISRWSVTGGNYSGLIIISSHFQQFSDIYILQDSVATCLKCGGIFKVKFVANLPIRLSAKEF